MLAAMRRHSADMILSNPPYIASDDLWNLQREILDHDPAVALDGGPDGLALHRQVAAGAAQALIAGGNLAVEVALGQAEDVVRVHEAAGFRHERTLRDLAGIDRVVVSRRMGE
jgi:release factor glutamine methyltransferase